MTSTGTEDSSGDWNSKAKDSSDGGKEQETGPWASKVPPTVGSGNNSGSWNTTPKGTRSEEKADDPWCSRGGNDNIKKTDSWGSGCSGGNQESSWSKPNFSSGDQWMEQATIFFMIMVEIVVVALDVWISRQRERKEFRGWWILIEWRK